jgi:glycosyltransferase involved in cell wall biosynthesis
LAWVKANKFLGKEVSKMENQEKPLVSLILPAKNEGSHVRTTIRSAFQVKTDCPFEIIVVDDGSTDGCCDFIPTHERAEQITLVRTEGIGAAAARNLGAKHAKGEYFIFCDAHLFFEDFWIERLLEPILTGKADSTTPGIANTELPNWPGYGQTLDGNLGIVWHTGKLNMFPTAVLPGGCFAIPRHVFFDIGGFDKGFRVWGYEDVEISIKMWLFGYTCYVQPAVKILHVFRSAHPYEVKWDHVYYNLLRMAYSHFKEERIEKCRKLVQYANLSEIESQVLENGVMEQRETYLKRRKYDDDWYMQTFNIPF